MSVVKSFVLGLGGAAVVATGVASTGSTANAQQVVAATPGACEIYAQEYAAVNAPQFGTAGYNTAYRVAYNECLTGGPSFVGGPVAGVGRVAGSALHGGAYVAGSALHAGANVAGTALGAGAAIAGTALSIPGAILGGTASALAPPATSAPVQPQVSTADPVEVKNYRGTYEEAPATADTAVVATEAPVESTAALAVAPEPFTPEWIAYCEAKYNSFDPETGMYLAYSGTYRMCN